MASSKHNETKPDLSFTEKDLEVTFCLVLDGLKVERKINKLFNKSPKNGQILSQTINDQSINFAVQMRPASGKKQDTSSSATNTWKVYRFEIKRLPTQIVPEKTKFEFEKDKVTIRLQKKVNEPWKSFIDSDFETIHLVKN